MLNYQEISLNDEKKIRDMITSLGFDICHTQSVSGENAVSVPYDDLKLSERSTDFLQSKGIYTLWKHQHLAIKEAKDGKNVCITTSTSSGKTEIFQIAAIESLCKQPDSKVLAIYPMKALNRDQVERWNNKGANLKVGKIDGDTPMDKREEILKDYQVVVMTPDVIHAFLLSRLNDKKIGRTVCNFISHLSLIVIDELHLYKGVFGTNAAYLFRRLNNVRRLLRKDKTFAQYITASATLPSAIEHSYNITGVKDFIEIGQKEDASPMSERVFYYIKKSEGISNNNGGNVTDLVRAFAQVEGAKSITFVEGRQQTGDIANVAGNFEASGIYPYRAGYEAESVNIISEKFKSGDFKGVISTSALEIGMNIDGLNVAIIADMPHDKNSYQQRIGRVGRYGCEKSYVIIVRSDSFASQLLFEEFDYDMDKALPDYIPALYMEDETIQMIHAHCHVGNHDNCEYEQWKGKSGKTDKFNDGGCFPASFVQVCVRVLTGQINNDSEERIIKCAAPHWSYSLRVWGTQYDIIPTNDEKEYIPKEQISREQIRTEGYIGALRNTLNHGQKMRERVVDISFPRQEISVRKVMRKDDFFISTRSNSRRYVIPNFKKAFRNKTLSFGETIFFNLRIIENCNIYGYKECKNKQSIYHKYEKRLSLPALYSVGTMIFHPSLNGTGVKISHIAEILFEAFLKKNAFDRNDINYMGASLYFSNEVLHRGDKFVALYDANDMGINLTKRLLNDTWLKDVFEYIYMYRDVIANNVCPNINVATADALEALCLSILGNEICDDDIELGEELIFADFTKALYCVEDPDEPNNPEKYVKQECIITGRSSSSASNFNIIVDGKFIPDIPIDRLEATEDTQFVKGAIYG